MCLMNYSKKIKKKFGFLLNYGFTLNEDTCSLWDCCLRYKKERFIINVFYSKKHVDIGIEYDITGKEYQYQYNYKFIPEVPVFGEIENGKIRKNLRLCDALFGEEIKTLDNIIRNTPEKKARRRLR